MKGNQFVHKILPASMEKPNQKEIGLAKLASTNGSCHCRMSHDPILVCNVDDRLREVGFVVDRPVQKTHASPG